MPISAQKNLRSLTIPHQVPLLTQEEKSFLDIAKEWLCKQAPAGGLSLAGVEVQAFAGLFGGNLGFDIGITSRFQLYATGYGSFGGGAGLGINLLQGKGINFGATQPGTHTETGTALFGSFGSGAAGGGSLYLSDSGGGGVGIARAREREGRGIGGGVATGNYSAFVAATSGLCGD